MAPNEQPLMPTSRAATALLPVPATLARSGLHRLRAARLGRARGLFVALAVAAVIPVLLFGAWVAYLTATGERDRARAATSQAVDTLARQLEAEIQQEVQVAEALALSTTLDIPDLQRFYETAKRIAASRPLWETVSLSSPDGAQILNVLRPFGDRLGPVGDKESLERVLRTRKPVLGDIGRSDSLAGKRLVPLRVPVLRNDEVVYVLTIGLRPDQISAALRESTVGPDWIGVVADARGNVVARTVAEESEAGKPASAAVRDAIARSSSGTYRGATLEGVVVDTAFRTLPGLGGWSVHLGVPTQRLDEPVSRSIGFLFGGAAGSVALAIGLGLLIARDVAQRRADEALRAAVALDASERRLAVAVDAAELGTWRWDLQTETIVGSARFQRLVGLPDRGMSTWRSDDFVDRVHPSDRDGLRGAVRSAVEQGRPLDVEFRILRPEGTHCWVRLFGRVERADGEDGRVLHGVVADVDAEKRAAAERADLLRRLAAAQEAEQRRIARELHDQVGQTVTGLSLGLKSLERALGEGAAEDLRERLRWLQGLAGDIGREIHRAAADLRPTALDDLGLFRALPPVLADWSERFGVAVDLQVVGGEERLPVTVETAIYRVILEGLTNVLKHAEARSVSVVLERYDGELRVVVEDDGKGFDQQAPREPGDAGLGLSGMRERLALLGGSLTIESTPGFGTTLFIEVPLSIEADA